LCIEKFRPDVLFVIPGLTAGGAERVVTTLANAFVDAGGNASIFPWYCGEHSFYQLDHRVQIFPSVKQLAKKSQNVSALRFLSNLRTFRRFIRKNDSPVVISFLPESNCLTLLATFGLGKVIIISERNLIKARIISRFWKLMRWLLYRCADVVVINNEENRAILERYVASSRIVNIPNPVVRLPTMAQLSGHRRRVVVAIGRLVPQKNYGLLIHEFARSRINEKGWELEIVGEGPEHESLVRKIEWLGMSDDITLVGGCADPWERYKDASLFLMTSDYEGMPNALLEALAHGLVPVVSDAVGDLAQQIAVVDPRLVVPSKTEGKIAHSLRTIALNQERRERYSNCMRAIAEPYSVERITEKWVTIISAI